jgi:hypothetical protein
MGYMARADAYTIRWVRAQPARVTVAHLVEEREDNDTGVFCWCYYWCDPDGTRHFLGGMVGKQMKDQKRSLRDMANVIWTDGKKWTLFTSDPALIRQIKGWDAFKDGRITQCCEYYADIEHFSRGTYAAVQFKFATLLLNRVQKAAELKVNRREAKADAP